MSDLVPHSPNLPERRDPTPVHQAVQEQLVAEIGETRLGKLHDTVDAKTFAAILHWLSGANRSALPTKHRYAEDIAAFSEWAANHTGLRPVPLLDALDFDAITVWTVYARSQGMAVRSQRRILAAVSSLFGDAAPRGWARYNPVSFKHHAPKVGTETNGRPAGATRVLPATDCARLATAAETPEEHLVFGCMFQLGLRVSELVNLRVENVDHNVTPPVLHFQRKGGLWKQREIPVDLQPHFDTLTAGRDEGPLLVDPKTGNARNRHQLTDITRRLARHAKIPHPVSVTPHTLRASAITDLLNSGANLAEVQAWVDHKHATTTQGYWERSNGLKRDSALTASLSARLANLAAGLNS